MPSGPAPADKLLRDTLNITDIPGAVPRPKTPAARAAAARAAAMASVGGCMGSRGSSSPRVHMHASKRPGVLEVSDIEGATATWHQVHRYVSCGFQLLSLLVATAWRTPQRSFVRMQSFLGLLKLGSSLALVKFAWLPAGFANRGWLYVFQS